MPKILSPEQKAAYERDGYLFPFDAFSAEKAAGFYRTLLDFEEEIGQDPLNVLRIKSHLVAPFVSEIARSPVILDVVGDLIGPDIRLYLSALWAKKANDPKFVSWHQDSTYYGLDPHEVVTVWVALTPSTAQSGCVRVLPGSHRQPDMQHVETRDPLNLLSRGQSIMGIDDAEAVNMELQPGQFSVHHERMVHGSPPNASVLPRVGVSYTFMPCHVRSTIGRKGAIMMRGEDRFGNWDEDPLPRFNQDPVSGAVLKKFQQEYRDPNLLTEAERAAGSSPSA